MAGALHRAAAMSRLAEPIGPGDHVLGPPGAPVTLLEYGDYECPFCARAYAAVHVVLDRIGDRVRFAYRHFPLSQIHPHALLAAQAAEAAAAQGRFWEMHGLLYESHGALEPQQLLEYADAARLDVVRFAQEMREEVYAPRVRSDLLSGIHSDVRGTPTFFVNAERLDAPWSPDSLLAAIAQAA